MAEQLSLMQDMITPKLDTENHSLIQQKLMSIKPETYNAVGSMHKYWGKKPYNIVAELLKHFTQPGDVVLDPFCGSGVAIAQAFQLGRKSIGVDLNPAAVFLTKESITPIDVQIYDKELRRIRDSLLSLEEKIYSYPCSCGNKALMIAAVRSREDEITRLKLKCSSCGSTEREVTDEDKKITAKADALKITSWYPTSRMYRNGRINVKRDQRVSDLYTKRNLNLCAELWSEIDRVSDKEVKSALKLAFTANLSNASKLTPIIRQRGAMNAGAWMTGYYVAAEYLEQNVIHYFLNRANKVRKAKVEIEQFPYLDNKNFSPKIHQANSESLNFINESSVDFVFTDPPYGDAVPYMEQSLLWNSWLGFDQSVFDNEIVISDSPERSKKFDQYIGGLKKAFSELKRVTRPKATMCITFHNMKGEVWTAFISTVLNSGFELIDTLTIYQKTSTPRQLNRVDSIKCDFLLVFRKSAAQKKIKNLDCDECRNISKLSLRKAIETKAGLTTDEIFSIALKELLMSGVPSEEFDLVGFVSEFLEYKNGLWREAISQ